MKPLWIAALVLVCMLVVAGCAPAATPARPATPLPPPTPMPPTPAPDLVAPVKAWAEAFNKGDVDAALAPFADDVTWQGWPVSLSGKQDLRRVFDRRAGMETSFQIKECQLQNDRVACSFTSIDGCGVALGAADGFTGKLEFVYAPDGMIRQVSLRLDDPKMQDYNRFSAQMAGWALANRAEEWAIADKGGKEGGAIMAKLCKEYAESLKVPSDPAAAVKAWVEAFNKGDVDSALAFFTDSATAMGYFQAGSKAELRMSFQWLAGMEAKLGAPDCKPGGGGLMCSFTYTDGCVAAAGITDGMGLRGAIDIQPDGKIRKAPLAADGEGWGKYALWNNKFEAWARANHADSWIKRDRLEFQPERVKLCKEYAESLKAAPTLAADLTAPVKAWADALNKGDVEAALAPLADNVWWKASYQASEMGKEAVRQVFTYLAGMETKQQIKECRQEADRVTCTVSITDGCIAAFGAPDGLPAELEFKFGDDGKIVESSMTADDPRWQERANFTGAVVAWASANRAEDFVKAEEDTIEAGSTLVKLCQEYAESLK